MFEGTVPVGWRGIQLREEQAHPFASGQRSVESLMAKTVGVEPYRIQEQKLIIIILIIMN